jgi:NADPH:quinone reductase-like Zn-dependent oxidoreductase
MKAVVYRRHGPPDVLEVEDLPKPVPTDDQVLIKVRAASANPIDWHFIRGDPYFVRLATLGKVKRPGADVAGDVEAVGSKVTRFKPGDEVFGFGRGSFAEYACAPQSALALKPKGVTFEQAGSVGVAGLTALQGLRDHGQLRAGQKVLINGAGGGVGTFAVQIAKALGAEVTAVSRTENLELARSIGADHVIDYTKEDFTRSGHRYDVILDNYATHSFSECRRVLNPEGRYVVAGGPTESMISMLSGLIAGLVESLFASQKMAVFVTRPKEGQLDFLRELMETRKLTPVIDRRYPLSEVREAIAYLEQGHARGKVVLTLEPPPASAAAAGSSSS